MSRFLKEYKDELELAEMRLESARSKTERVELRLAEALQRASAKELIASIERDLQEALWKERKAQQHRDWRHGIFYACIEAELRSITRDANKRFKSPAMLGQFVHGEVQKLIDL